MKSRIQEIIMIIAYGLLICLARWFYMSSDTASAKSGVVYIIALFVIVLVMYIYSFIGFFRINKMISALNKFRKRIIKDFQAQKDNERPWEALWNKYKGEEIWFSEKTLDSQVGKYIAKTRINDQTAKSAFSEDIEEYIGYDLIDDKIHKEIISAFPGIMTGLGILFTFFGLSICLQSFSTSSAEEIMAGIDPLMSGLKVAFHTSIYGLIFSMVFNFCYRKKIEDGYNAIHDFLDEYRRCVHPENQVDGMNKLIAYEATQLAAIKSIANSLVSDLSEAFYTIMTPQFEHMNSIIENFAVAASKVQTDGMQRMVGAFLVELNNAVGHSFDEVRSAMLETSGIQKDYNKQLQSCLLEMSRFIESAHNMSVGMDVSLSKMESYFDGMEELQKGVEDSFAAYSSHIAYNNDILAKQQENLTALTNVQQDGESRLIQLKQETESTMAQLKQETESALAQLDQETQTVLNQIKQENLSTLTMLQQNINDTLLKLNESSDSLINTVSDVKTSLNDLEDTTVKTGESIMKQIEKSEMHKRSERISVPQADTLDDISFDLDADFINTNGT